MYELHVRHTLTSHIYLQGDALASFLENPDHETLGISTVEKQDFRNGIWDHRWVKPSPMPWKQREKCAWFRAIGVKWWMIDMIV
jgi:hypothetical protein